MPDYRDCSVLVNDFGNFFARKIGKIRSDLDSVNLDLNENQIVPQEFHLDVNNKLPELEILVEDNVLSLIQSSSVKSCLLNPMPTPLVVVCVDVLLPVITTLKVQNDILPSMDKQH